jgi:hypothetical protein
VKERLVTSGLPGLVGDQGGSSKKGSFDDQVRMVLVIGAILLTALGFVVYAFVRDPTVLVTNQAMTFIVGYYFHKQ